MAARDAETSASDLDIPHITLAGPLATLLEGRRTIARACFAGVLLGLAVAFALPQTFTSRASFMPESRRATTSLSGLASQLGVAVPLDDPGESPQFYIDLMKSNEILRRVATATYTTRTPEGVRRGALTLFLDARGATPALRERDAMRRLADRISASASLRTGVIDVAFRAPYSDLAQEVLQHLLAEVNAFNLQRRQSRARAERVFDEQRLTDAMDSLRAAQDRLAQFEEANRDYRMSPLLGLQHARLLADATAAQQLVGTMRDLYERARVEEIRDSPVVTTLDPADLPLKPDPRGAVQDAVLGGFAGLMISLLALYWPRMLGRKAGESGVDLRRFEEARSATVNDIKRPWRLLRRSEM